MDFKGLLDYKKAFRYRFNIPQNMVVKEKIDETRKN